MKLSDISDYNSKARLFWMMTVAAGGATLVWAAYECRALLPAQWEHAFALFVLMCLVNMPPLRIPSVSDSVTLGDAFTFFCALSLGVPAAVLISFLGACVGSWRESKRLMTRLAAPSVNALATFAAALAAYFTLARYTGVRAYPLAHYSLDFADVIVPLLVMAATQYVVDCLLVSAMQALQGRNRWREYWRENYLWTAGAFVASAFVAAVFYEATISYGLLHVALGALIIATTYGSYKTYFERVTEKTNEAAEVSRLHLATVEALATAIDAKDQTTHCHIRRVQIYAARMGKIFNLPDEEIEVLKAGALLHDIGKLAVPDHILNKTSALSPAEFERVKVHTVVGAEILERVKFPYPVVPIVRWHHERWDGKGYPDGLKGEEIPLTARILAVADCFDTAREDRPWRKGMTRDEACQLLQRKSGAHFDPRVVATFLEHAPLFEAEIRAQELDTGYACDESGASESWALWAENPAPRTFAPAYLDQIRSAHREVLALYEIARTFNSSLDIEEMAPILVGKVGEIVPFDACALYLIEERKPHARIAHAAGVGAERLRGHIVAPGAGAIGTLLSKRRPERRIDPMIDFAGLELPAHVHFNSMAALPLVKDGQLIGALAVYSLTPNRYNDDHLRLLDTIARLAADALGNAMLHAATQSSAHTDAITGLPNARALYARFDEEAARAERGGGSFQVVMMDLDDFKRVNDTFGHKVGDRVLRGASAVIQNQLREYDFLARYAGDELVALVLDMSDEQVDELRKRIEAAVTDYRLEVAPEEDIVTGKGGVARIGISVGAACYDVDGDTLDQLIVAADQAMYRVKARHKQRAQTLPVEAVPVNITRVASTDAPPDNNLASSAIN